METTWQEDQQQLLLLTEQHTAATVQRCLLAALRYANTPPQFVDLLWFSLKTADDPNIPNGDRHDR